MEKFKVKLNEVKAFIPNPINARSFTKKPEMGIYAIICEVKKRIYIGQSKNVSVRLRNHLYTLKKNEYANGKIFQMQDDFNQLGENSFVFIKICDIDDKKQLFDKETEIIKEYVDKGYLPYNTFINTETTGMFCPVKFKPLVARVVALLDDGKLNMAQLEQQLDYLESIG